MKNIVISGFLVLAAFTSLAQPRRVAVTKVVEWNLDAPAPTGLPLNQYINFKIKSKKEDLSKVVCVLILEHDGNRTAGRSFRTYNSRELVKHLYTINAIYHSDSSYLEVPMRVEDNEETKEKRVLQPSKFYTFYFITSRIGPLQQQLLQQSKDYMDAISAGNPAAAAGYLAQAQLTHAAIYASIQGQRDILSEQEKSFQTYIQWYQTDVYPFEVNKSSAQGDLDSYMNGLALNGPAFQDSVIHFVFQSLNFNAAKKDSIAKPVCDEPPCQLYRLFLGLYHMDNASLVPLILGRETLADAINPLFALAPSTQASVANIDTTISQLERLKNYLMILRDNNLSAQPLRPPSFYTNRFYPENIYNDLQTYILAINTVQGQLRGARPLVQALVQVKSDEQDEILESLAFIHYSMFLADTYVYNIETRNNLFIAPIFGYAVYGFQKDFTSFTPYTGLHFNFSQLDESVPFRLLRHKTAGQRLGFETGITIASFKKESKRENLFGNSSSLFTGAGFKLSHYVSVAGGVIWFRKEDANPFITDTRVTSTPYGAVSLNIALKKLFEGLSGLLPLK